MYCEHCGTVINTDSTFCPQCGQRIHEESTAQRPPRSGLRSTRTRPRQKVRNIVVFSIPAAFLVLVVVWFLSGIFGGQPEGFEKYLPDTTVAYVEIHDPIGRVVDFEKSLFFKKLSATQAWKELENSNESLRNHKDTLARVAALRGAVGPLGLAFIPSFSDDAPLFYVRVKKGYAGTVKIGLETVLESQSIKFRKSQPGGRIRYDLETPPGYSLLIMDFGVLGGDANLLQKYIDWIDRQPKAALLSAPNYRKVVQTPGSTTFARVFTHSAILQSAVGKVGDPSALKIIQNFPEWISKTDLEFNNGILLKSSTSVNDKRLIEASKKPISNRSIKYLPRDTAALATLNLPLVAEFAKEEIRRSGAEGRERELERLLETLQGEGLFALVPDSRGQLSEGSFLLAVQQKQPSASVKALGDLLREIGGPPQVKRYGAHEITCYPGPPLCFTEIEDFLFLSSNEGLIQNVADVKAGKAAGFQDAVKSDGNLRKILGSQSHGVFYTDLKALALWGNLLWETNEIEAKLRNKLRGSIKPSYMAGATYMRGEVFEGEGLLYADFSEFGDVLFELVEKQSSEYRARGIDAVLKSDLRNAATAQEAFFVGANRYATHVRDLRGYNPSPGVTLNVDYADATRFVLTARKPGGTVPSWTYDSRTGTLTAGRPVQSGALQSGLTGKGSAGQFVPSMGHRHIGPPEVGTITYNSDPPTSGPHLPSIATWGIHENPIPKELQVHNLEDGGVVIQYNCPQTNPQCQVVIDRLARIARRYNHVVLAPYPGMSHKIALTAWTRIDKFNEFDEQRIVNFIEAYVNLDHHPVGTASSP